MFTSVLGPTHPPIQWVLGVLFPGVKWLGHETDISRPFSAVPIFLLYAFHDIDMENLKFTFAALVNILSSVP